MSRSLVGEWEPYKKVRGCDNLAKIPALTAASTEYLIRKSNNPRMSMTTDNQLDARLVLFRRMRPIQKQRFF